MKQTILKQRQLRFDEINSLGSELAYMESSEGVSAEEIEKRKERFHDCLIDFFVDGFSSGILQIGEDKDLPDPYKFLDIRYSDGETPTDKFLEYVEGKPEEMQRLLEAEANRMFNQGSMEAVKGIKGTKTWETMRDPKVRNSHEYLQSKTIGIDEEFVTIGGDSALAPGLFKNASENCNCRCWCTFKKDKQE